MIFCIIKVTTVIPVQQQNPINIGLTPDLISSMTLQLSPMAPIAMVIKNLLSSLRGTKVVADTPCDKAMVVITEASTKNKMKMGKDFLILNPLLCSSLRAR